MGSATIFRNEWDITPFVTFWGTLVANEVQKLSNKFVLVLGQEGSLWDSCPPVPLYLRTRLTFPPCPVN